VTFCMLRMAVYQIEAEPIIESRQSVVPNSSVDIETGFNVGSCVAVSSPKELLKWPVTWVYGGPSLISNIALRNLELL
jgi:hypothetical protein